MERAALIGVCPLHLLSSLLTVSGCLKHSCQWSSVSPPIHPQSCLLCNYSSPGFCSAPNLEAALWCARARPSFRGPEFTRPGSRSPPTPFSFHTGVQKCADLQSPERDTISRLTASVRRNRGNPSTMAWTSIRHSKNPQPCAARKTQPLSFAAIVTAGYCDSCFLEGTLCQRCEWHKCYELEMLLNKWMWRS